MYVLCHSGRPTRSAPDRGRDLPPGSRPRPAWLRPRPARVIVLAVALAALLAPAAACRDSGTPSAGGTVPGTPAPATSTAPAATGTPTGAASSSRPTSPAPTSPSRTSGSTRPAATAAADLAAYARAARRVDDLLHNAATKINGGITSTEIRVDAATSQAVREADPGLAAAAIPPGMNSALLRATLLVQSDLIVRRAAFNRFSYGGVFPRDQEPGSGMLGCLANGAKGAARFDADLAALESLAARSAPVRVAAADSQAAAEIAVRVRQLMLAHNGCAGCGRTIQPELVPMTWSRVPVHGSRAEGVIGAIGFEAEYTPSNGWTAVVFAC